MKKRILVAPSLLASDWARLAEEVKAVEQAGADMLHLDVMDGSFVPPITFGADFVKAVKKVSDLPLDVHLMIVEPEKHLKAFADAGADIITVHQETCPHLHRSIQSIHELGRKAGVAINPATPTVVLNEIVSSADLLLIMTVNPGWGGQSFIQETLPKIKAARQLIERSGRKLLLEVDGGINAETALAAVEAGADTLVAGTYIFQAKNDYQSRILSLKAGSKS